MRVLMLGWEFPPHISGGLGTACYGLTKGLDEIGVEVCFVLPTAIPVESSSHVAFRSPTNLLARSESWVEQYSKVFGHVDFRQVPAALQPYARPGPPDRRAVTTARTEPTTVRQGRSVLEEMSIVTGAGSVPSGSFVRGAGVNYQGDMMNQVHRYARLALGISEYEAFDVIHAHDWMTYPAGLAIAAVTGKPLVIHVHSTEFDRSGDNVDQRVYDIERAGMHGAARVVCVSHYTRGIVLSRYGVPPERVEVVHNAVELPDEGEWSLKPIRRNEKIVLFLGRMTMQKGPEYFLMAAKKVVERFKNVRFVMAGSGDMVTQCIRLAADLRLGGYVTFTGFLRGKDVDKVFSMADLYVMPSVSEPFGIAPLEALSHNVPVIISKQSGVSEVLSHALKVDFWDTDEMANQILAVLRHPPLQKTLRQHGHIELQKLSWKDSATKLKGIYDDVLTARA